MGAELRLKMLITVFRVLKRNIGEGAEEIVVVNDPHIIDRVEMLLLDMLLEAAGGSAGLGSHLGIEEIIAAFKGALQQGTGIVAYTAGEIISCNVGRSTPRCSQSDRETAGKVKEHFRHEITGIADSSFAVSFSLFDEVIICLLKELLEKDEMFKVFQRITP